MTRGRRTPHGQSGLYILTAAQEPHPQQSSKLTPLEPLLCLLLPAFTLAGSFDNFQVPLRDASNKEYEELLTGTIEVFICVPYMFVKLYESVANLPQVLTSKSCIQLPTWPPNIRVFRDTAVVVIISYAVLLDINLNYIKLAIFPVIAIGFIYALYIELYRRTGGGGKSTAGSSNIDEKTIKIPVELEIIVMVTFVALLVMDQLPDHVAEGFAISQFLLFLSTTLAAVTRMMMKLPASASPGIAPASELLHKTLFLLLLVTVHTVAAEAFGEDVVLVCMPEVVPVLLWFSLHLDRAAGSSSIISLDKMKLHSWKRHIILGAPMVALLFAYLGSSMDVPGLSWCTTISVSCGVSGILTSYLVFMLHHWPRQQTADAGSSSSSKDVASSIDNSSKDSSSSGMLKLWADALLIAAAALLLLNCSVRFKLFNVLTLF